MNLSADNVETKPLVAVILAAGKGTRMQSELPKVLHPVNGKPMLQWVVDAVRTANADRIILVIGHGSEEVRMNFLDCEYAIQEPQLGTGHAVMCCEELLQNFGGDILVLGGDGPLLQPSTITAMMEIHRTSNASATLATRPQSRRSLPLLASPGFLQAHETANRKSGVLRSSASGA